MCAKTWVLANRMPVRIGESGLILQPNTFSNRNSPMRSGILPAGTQVLHRPRSNSLLNFDIGNILPRVKIVWNNEMLALAV